MSTRCSTGPRTGTSGQGQPAHTTRSNVLIHYAERAIAETRFNMPEFAEALAVAYCRTVPEHARLTEFNPPASDFYREFAKQLDRLRKRCERWMSREIMVPADMEEAWCLALDTVPTTMADGYGEQARTALSRRHGHMGARAPSSEPAAGDGDMLRSISATSSSGMQSIIAMLEDGVVDAKDLQEAPSAYAALTDIIAAATAAQARICEQTGYRPEVFQVIGGREVSA